MADADNFQVVTTGLRFPEGPVYLTDGSLLVVEIAGRALTRIAPDSGRQTVIADLQGGPNGAAMGPDGWCYVCNSGGWRYVTEGGVQRPIAQAEQPGWIERVHLATGRVERLYDRAGDRPLHSPNDLVFDDKGGFWFTDHGKRTDDRLDIGGVFYAAADGSFIRHAIGRLITPNGIGLSPDGQTLYVAETVTRRLWAFDITGPGTVASHPFPSPNGGRLVAGLPDLNNLDSLAVDAAGNISVATLTRGGIWTLSPDGAARNYLPLPDVYVTNLCFGGPDLSTAYVTLSGSGRLIALPWPRPGLPLHPHQR